MVTATPTQFESLLAAGAQVVVRDEEWLVDPGSADARPTGCMVRCLGTSALVRDTAGHVLHRASTTSSRCSRRTRCWWPTSRPSSAPPVSTSRR